MAILKTKNKFYFFTFILFISSCSTATLEEICSEHFSQLKNDVALARTTVKSYLPDLGPNRAIASLKQPTHTSSWSEANRIEWKEWGINKLKRLQEIQDWLEEYHHEPEINRALSQAADEMVLFYSYAGLNEIQSMVDSLMIVEKEQLKAQNKVCSKKM